MRDIARRSILAGISAAPAVVIGASLPTAVLAHPAAVEPAMGIPMTTDADLIATTHRVIRWARLEGEAEKRLCDAEDRRDAMRPPKPADITADLNRIAASVLDEFPNPIPADDDAMLGAYVTRAQDAARPLHDQHQAAMRAWRAASEQAERDSGFTDARSLATWISGRLVRSAEALTATPAQTMAGVTAKAQAFQAVQEAGWQHCIASWRDDLATSIVADVLRIGAGAA